MYKAIVIASLIAVANAGLLDYHVGATAENTVRGFGGQSSISSQSRQVNSAFSTSSAYKNKATNNAVYAAPAFAAPAYAAPAYAAHAYAAPVAHAVAAPAYAAPVARVAAPVARVAAHPAGLLGVAYSPVIPGVATATFDGFGVHYGY